jgi:hypothetical protein
MILTLSLLLSYIYIYICTLAVPGHELLWLMLVKCKRSVSSLLQVLAVQLTFGWHPVAAAQHILGWHPVAAVQHTFGWHPVAAVQHTFGWHPVAAVQHTFCWHPVAAVQHTFTHKQYTEYREQNIHKKIWTCAPCPGFPNKHVCTCHGCYMYIKTCVYWNARLCRKLKVPATRRCAWVWLNGIV